MGTEALVVASIAGSVLSAGATVMAAKNQADSAKAAAALARRQQEERKAIIQADMLDKENEILRQKDRTLSSIHAQRPFNADPTGMGSGHIRAGINEEIRLADASIRSMKIQGLQSIRTGQFDVAGAELTAAGARSRVGTAVIGALGSVAATSAKAGVTLNTGSPQGPLRTESGFRYEFDRP
tara:strand:+ start:8522 stop:9067 length:546 start_codon:yes stop_codon:yes gene_type:complete